MTRMGAPRPFVTALAASEVIFVIVVGVGLAALMTLLLTRFTTPIMKALMSL